MCAVRLIPDVGLAADVGLVASPCSASSGLTGTAGGAQGVDPPKGKGDGPALVFRRLKAHPEESRSHF
jgi:hypothetical protein